MSPSPRRRPARRLCVFELLESRAVPAVVFSPAAAAELQADTQDLAAGGASSFLLDQYRVVDNHGTLRLVTSGGGSTFDQNYSNVITRVGGASRGGFTASNSVDFFLHELLARSADPANGDGTDFSSLGINLLGESYTTSGDTTTFDLVYTAGGYRFDQHFTMRATPDSSTGSYTSADAINTFAADLDAHRNEFLNWKYPASSGPNSGTGTSPTGTSVDATGATVTSSVTQYSRASRVKPGTSLGTYGYTLGDTGGAGAGSTSTATGATTGTGVVGTGTTTGTGVTTGTGSNGTGNTTGTGTLTGTGTTTSGIGTTGTGSGTNIGPGTTGTGLGTGTIGTGSGTGIGTGITGTGSGVGTGTTSVGTGIGTGTTGTGVGTGITGQGSTTSPSGSLDLGSSTPAATAETGAQSPSSPGPLVTLAAPGTPLVNPGPAITSDNGSTLGA